MRLKEAWLKEMDILGEINDITCKIIKHNMNECRVSLQSLQIRHDELILRLERLREENI